MIRRSLTAVTLITLAFIAWPAFLKAYSSNPPTKRTGAPGEGNCSSCHGALNDGLGTLTINAPATFIPGQTYPITVTLARSGQSRWGFSLTALHKADNSMAGAFINTTAFTGTQVSTGKTYINQIATSSDGSFSGDPGPVTWSFNWTAPPAAAGADTVIFYAAGVAADNSGDADNADLVYTKTALSAANVATPTLTLTWGQVKARYR